MGVSLHVFLCPLRLSPSKLFIATFTGRESPNDPIIRFRTPVASSLRRHSCLPRRQGSKVDRFFAAVKKFDDYLASPEPLHSPAEGLLQAPVADSLTHIGQIAMLRRLAGSPVKGENYFKAEIAPGRVGLEQSAPRREFE